MTRPISRRTRSSVRVRSGSCLGLPLALRRAEKAAAARRARLAFVSSLFGRDGAVVVGVLFVLALVVVLVRT